MWHRENNVISRKNLRKTTTILTQPTSVKYKLTDVEKVARLCAMVVCLTTTWLVISGIRYIFEPDLPLLPGDEKLFEFLFNSNDSPSRGEIYMMRNFGCAMLAKGVLDLCVTFGGGPKHTFTMLCLFNILAVWSIMASIFLNDNEIDNNSLPLLSINSEVVLAFLLMLEAPCLFKLGETNGVAENDVTDHDH